MLGVFVVLAFVVQIGSATVNEVSFLQKLVTPGFVPDGAQFGLGLASTEDQVFATGNARQNIFVFSKATPTSWEQSARLIPSSAVENGGNKHGFFCGLASLDVSGDILVVGAHCNNEDDGEVFVFERSNQAWEEKFKVSGNQSEHFGISVSVDGDFFVVGAPGPNNQTKPGAAYLFKRSGNGQWNKVGKISAHNGEDGDGFGLSVAIDGDDIVVGAPRWGSDTGSVYVFGTNEGGEDNFGFVQNLNTSVPGGLFGKVVSVSEHLIAVGAPLLKTAFLFVLEGSWVEKTFVQSIENGFGNNVHVSGRSLVVGAPTDGNGTAYVYTVNETNVALEGKIDPNPGYPGDSFGLRTSIVTVGNVAQIAISAPLDDSITPNNPNLKDNGAVYMFEYELPPTASPTQAPVLHPTGSPTTPIPTSSPTPTPPYELYLGVGIPAGSLVLLAGFAALVMLMRYYRRRREDHSYLEAYPFQRHMDSGRTSVALKLSTILKANHDDIEDQPYFSKTNNALFLKGASNGGRLGLRAVKEGIVLGVHPDYADDNGETALIKSAKAGHTNIVHYLLKNSKADPNAWDKHGTTALMHALQNSHDDTCLEIIGDGRITLDSIDKDGRDWNEFASENRTPDSFKLLRGLTSSVTRLLVKLNMKKFVDIFAAEGLYSLNDIEEMMVDADAGERRLRTFGLSDDHIAKLFEARQAHNFGFAAISERKPREYHVFMSYSWPPTNEDVVNNRIERLYNALTGLGLKVWRDKLQIGTGDLIEQMSNGISNSAVFIFLVSQSYLEKVENRTKRPDDCEREFTFAAQTKHNDLMIPVVVEEGLTDMKRWPNKVRFVCSADLFVDLTKEQSFAQNVNFLVQSVHQAIKKSNETVG